MGGKAIQRNGKGRPEETPATCAPPTAEALFRAIIDTSDDAIFTTDCNGRITGWSVTAERLFGCPAAGAVDHPMELLFAPHLRPDARALMARVCAGERVTHFESEFLRPDGMPVPISLSVCPVGAESPEEVPVGALVVARDVTEQRLAQATLAEVEVRLEEGEALAHVGSWLWDIRTGTVQWSTEFHRIHAVDPSEFDGTFESHLAPLHPDDREWVREQLERSVTSGRPFDAGYRIVRPDGEVRLIRARAQPTVGSAGTVVGLRGIGQDVTGRDAPPATPAPPGA